MRDGTAPQDLVSGRRFKGVLGSFGEGRLSPPLQVQLLGGWAILDLLGSGQRGAWGRKHREGAHQSLAPLTKNSARLLKLTLSALVTYAKYSYQITRNASY